MPSLYSLSLSQSSGCTLGFTGAYANHQYDCCYQNAYAAPGTLADEVDFFASTSYQTLMNTEP
jgi:hypothetical protein